MHDSMTYAEAQREDSRGQPDRVIGQAAEPLQIARSRVFVLFCMWMCPIHAVSVEHVVAMTRFRVSHGA